MKTQYVFLVLVAVGAASYGAYQYGMNQGMKMAGTPSANPPDSGAAQAGGKKVLYWHDPMYPGQKFDKPGKSPFMDMQLVPVYAEGEGDQGNVSISPRMQQNLGVRTAVVIVGAVTPAVEAVGTVAWNERDVAVVQARSNGFLERLYVRAPLDPVRRGQPLAELYVPDWVAAQEEFLSIKRMRGNDLAPLLDGARQRMRLAGMSDEQIRLVEGSGQVHSRLTITAPIGGVIGELSAREGMTVMAGAPLFRINGLGTIWVNAEVPESVASLVRPGNAVEARAPALPDAMFKGKVSAILPEVNPATRTLKARVELANPAGRLVPGMFATVNFAPATRKNVLLVPTEAVITTGKRNVVIVAQGDGKFAPVDVEIGMEANGQTEIRKGLAAGQKVVVSGQFLLDSEASLKGSAMRMGDSSGAGTGAAADPMHKGEGKVEKIGNDELVLSHGPIASMQWGPMTMGFKPPAAGIPKDVTVGDRVTFEFHQGRGGQFEITTINRSGAMPAAKAADSAVKGDIKGMPK